MTPWKKIVLTSVLAAVAGAAGYGVFRPRAVEAEAGLVKRSHLRVQVLEEGRTRIKDRYVVSSPIAGRLQRVTLKPGDAVEADKTVLASILPADPQMLDTRSRAQAEAQMKAAQAGQSQAQANLDRAKSNHKYASDDLERIRQLKDSGALSHRDVDGAELKEQTAANDLRAAEFAAQVAQFELEQAKAALDLFADAANPSESLKPHVIKSPVSGRVLRVTLESATVVQPGAQILEIGDPGNLEVVVDVLSSDGVKIQPGAEVEIVRWGGAKPLQAQVRLVEPSAFLKVSALGVEEQRVNVVADFVSPPQERASLGDAFRVESGITLWEGASVLTIPASALFRRENAWACFVVKNGRAALQPLEIGHASDRDAEILSGVAEGDQVILSPSDKIRDGVPVRLRRND